MDGLREIAKEQINYSNIVYHTIAQREDVFSSLNAFIDEHQIEVIAMTRQNKSFIKRLFTGSLTKKMAYHSHIPLLAFHFKKDVQ
jgi:nucleotide-binding universal stress UspA family protein